MDFAAARQNMVDCQILPNRVDDQRIVEALLKIPREKFVPDNLTGIAYVDEIVPLGGQRYVMEAMVVARLLQTAALNAEDVALSIGCGTGYATAVLAQIVDTVVAVEPDKGLAQKANENLAAIGLDNVAVVEGKLEDGNIDQGPYNVIFFDGAVQTVPDAICDQLAEGGRLVAIVAGERVGTAYLYSRFGGVISKREVFDAGTPLLPGFRKQKSFVF
jgi:protein-L-isoaspartate(D-aspartate) O-methyltransferase|tara:strand:+ start:303 stop:953 length:651 start_codon:yes stop_codon:yes gene_type:complete